MEKVIISVIMVILVLLLFIFLIVNTCGYIKFSDIEVSCYYKRWGCCKDKLTEKLDPLGTNCRGF